MKFSPVKVENVSASKVEIREVIVDLSGTAALVDRQSYKALPLVARQMTITYRDSKFSKAEFSGPLMREDGEVGTRFHHYLLDEEDELPAWAAEIVKEYSHV